MTKDFDRNDKKRLEMTKDFDRNDKKTARNEKVNKIKKCPNGNHPDTLVISSENYLFSSWLLSAASASRSPRVVFSTLELIFLTAFLVLSASAAAFCARSSTAAA